MSDGSAFQMLAFSGLGNEAEELLAELQLSVDRLRHLDGHLLGQVQTLIDEIRCELGHVSGHLTKPSASDRDQTSG